MVFKGDDESNYKENQPYVILEGELIVSNGDQPYAALPVAEGTLIIGNDDEVNDSEHRNKNKNEGKIVLEDLPIEKDETIFISSNVETIYIPSQRDISAPLQFNYRSTAIILIATSTILITTWLLVVCLKRQKRNNKFKKFSVSQHFKKNKLASTGGYHGEQCNHLVIDFMHFEGAKRNSKSSKSSSSGDTIAEVFDDEDVSLFLKATASIEFGDQDDDFAKSIGSLGDDNDSVNSIDYI